MTARLILVCHGSTRALRTAAFPADDPLDEHGSATASTMTLRRRGLDHAWCGPSLAARQTAVALGIDAQVEPALRDCDFGRWSGLLFADVARQEPDAVRDWLADPGVAPHGGESLADVVGRVGEWLDGQRRHSGSIVAITHPSVIRAAVIGALGASAPSFWRIDISPLSQTELRAHQDRWNLRLPGPE